MSLIKRGFGLSCLLAALLALSASAEAACSPGSPQLIIYHAGSLTAAFSAVEQLFTQQTGVCVTDVSAGSVDAARRITTGQEPCDIFASAGFEVIDLMLKPAGFADYDILFAKGGMVLAYTTNSKNAATIAANTGFDPPGTVPEVAGTWTKQLMQPGVAIGGSHPFLDPSGYRADMIFQLATRVSKVPNLYDLLLDHYAVIKSNDSLGKTYDYQLIYEHSAFAAYKADSTKTYRYAKLPDQINLSNPRLNDFYRDAVVIMPGLGLPDAKSPVDIPGTRVLWGLTVLKGAPDADSAIKFL